MLGAYVTKYIEHRYTCHWCSLNRFRSSQQNQATTTAKRALLYLHSHTSMMQKQLLQVRQALHCWSAQQLHIAFDAWHSKMQVLRAERRTKLEGLQHWWHSLVKSATTYALRRWRSSEHRALLTLQWVTAVAKVGEEGGPWFNMKSNCDRCKLWQFAKQYRLYKAYRKHGPGKRWVQLLSCISSRMYWLVVHSNIWQCTRWPIPGICCKHMPIRWCASWAGFDAWQIRCF